MSSEAPKTGIDPAELFGLRDKGVLVTGATSLISLWTARLLLDVGARVVLTDRLDEAAIRGAVAALAAERGEPRLDLCDQVALVGSVDVRNRKPADVPAGKSDSLRSVEQMVREAKASLGAIDVLINMAGGQEPVPAAALSTEVFRRTVDRILVGTWNVVHEVFEQAMRDRGGRILSVTADVAQGYPGMPAMGAARNGLEALHRALSVEWAELGITCCVIAPGATDTPGLRRYPEADRVRELGIQAANLKRLLEPREVAWLFLCMASPWAVGVNGHTLVANGGDSNVTPVFQQMRRLWAG
ncbi:MAG: SDR family oxidoreductase [Deltaproteobacteria bacterium]|jgi:NAD(P)-dependent dehydrogenase (short-subunit alcohol dehydrogenase family)|nr:SDR family oxidoreductase [Deltaproteobacteria bacterium]MBW2535456.1 SDR family oxidoreductase [Deltaproteobacteria bacterium]